MIDFHDSGPAFPTEIGPGNDSGFQSGNERFHDPGMTLRDYFAAKAMQGFCAYGSVTNPDHCFTIEDVAHDAYAMADAMLTARNA